MSPAPTNSKQRLVLLIGGVLIGAMLLFPPWLSRSTAPGMGYSMSIKGYAFIFTPPQYANQIDTTRLLIQLLAVGIPAGAAYVFLKDR